MATQIGSISPLDYGGDFIRSTLTSIKAGTKPFDYEGEENETWRQFKILPAHISVALRVAQKAQDVQQPLTSTLGASTRSSPSKLEAAFLSFVEASQAQMDKAKKKIILPYKIPERRVEVGLADLTPALMPTEEALIHLESLAKPAREQGRNFIGSAEGEDLQAHFRSSWTRTPKIDILMGQESFKEKLKAAVHTQKERSMQAKVDYVSYANFTGHILD